VLVAFAFCAPQELLWSDFKTKFGRSYSASEEGYRFQVFAENVRMAEILNRIDTTANYGVTIFSDLTQDEFAAQYLNRPSHRSFTTTEDSPVLGATPDKWDWFKDGKTNPVQNQGSCGSCWAFASACVVASAVHIQKGKPLVLLSPQQLVDCETKSSGCDGGLEKWAMEYTISKGLETWAVYPYAGKQQTCKYDSKQALTYITSYGKVPSRNENKMRDYLYSNGPLTVAMNANTLQFYTDGIFNPSSCNPAILNHALMAVGYDVTAPTPYWIIQNSWGTSWGEKGLFRMVFGKNTCGISDDALYVKA
jgi:C1A family cysteine protease